MAKVVTIRTVAERAGCSIATVSRVINRSARTSPEVEARVLAAVRELGFRPNEIGRSLKTLRTRTLGVVIPSLTNPVFAVSVAGMEAEARRRQHTLLLTATDYDAAREPEMVETLVAQNVAGLVLTVADPNENPSLTQLDEAGIPYVLLYNLPQQAGRAAICVDDTGATEALTQAMIDQGHRNIVYLAGTFAASDRSRRRYAGYVAAMRAAGLTPANPVELDYLGDTEVHIRALEAIFSAGCAPTAALCSNDFLALSVIGALRALGLRVPEDVSIAGFDGIRLGAMMYPPLATVVTPTRRMGERAVEKIFEMLEQQAPPSIEQMPHTLRLGGTLAAARDAANGPQAPFRHGEATAGQAVSAGDPAP